MTSDAHDRVRARELANDLGAKAERFLRIAGVLEIPPTGHQLEWLESVLDEAIGADPTHADVQWDRAVIAARFRHDFVAARRHLSAAVALGYQHPMSPALNALIARAESGDAVPVEFAVGSDAEVALKRLLLQLVTAPGQPGDPSPPKDVIGGDALDSYRAAGMRLVREGGLTALMVQRVRETCRRLDGDAREYACDLLRTVAVAIGDPTQAKDATEEHLRVLAQMALSLGGSRDAGERTIDRARRVAERGIQVMEESKITVDADVHADILIALGQSNAAAGKVGEGARYYHEALVLKRKAANLPHAQRLETMLRSMLAHLVRGAFVPTLGGGVGRVHDDLVIAYAAARSIGDDVLEREVGLALATVYRAVRQPSEAESLLRHLLSVSGLTARERWRIRFDLASSLSEQGRGKEAAAIQQDLLDDPAGDTSAEIRGTLWLNLGNSRRVAGDRSGARRAFESALDSLRLPEDAGRGTVSTAWMKRLSTTALLAELDFGDGHTDVGHSRFVEAERIIDSKDAVVARLESQNLLHFHSLAARCYLDAGMHAESARHVTKARELLRSLLGQGPSLPVWESVLREWSYLDAAAIRAGLTTDTGEAREAALLAAEGAKGRLLTWLALRGADAGYRALDADHQRGALEQVRAWAAARSGRCVISLFAGARGLAVMTLGEQGALRGRWLDTFNYDEVATTAVGPWEGAIQDAQANDDAWARANAMTDDLLGRAGEWLYEAVPEIARGGDDLILLPHRLFRNLALMHSRLPNGQRLAELYRRVVIAPVLQDAVPPSSHGAADDGSRWRRATGAAVIALVDSDGTLPMARLEGLGIAGDDATLVGAQVTIDHVRNALTTGTTVLLSCHGMFQQDNPWASTIVAADGSIALHELITGGSRAVSSLVVLGVCEAGRSRRSVSDEPLAFPTLLVRQGVQTVVAPLWPVDDFTAFLFTTKFFGMMQGPPSISAPEAVAETARWLRELTPAPAIGHTQAIVRRVEATVRGRQALVDTDDALQESLQWLRDLGPNERPFASPLDWAAFQVTGVGYSAPAEPPA